MSSIRSRSMYASVFARDSACDAACSSLDAVMPIAASARFCISLAISFMRRSFSGFRGGGGGALFAVLRSLEREGMTESDESIRLIWGRFGWAVGAAPAGPSLDGPWGEESVE